MSLKNRIIKNIIKKVNGSVGGLILKTKNYNLSDSIIIFSETRGGSTWLMEMLYDTLDVCINWEPLHPNKGVVPKELNLGNRPFIPKDKNNNIYRTLFKNIHENKIHSNWTRKHIGSPFKLISSKYVLTKYVRANMLVPYLIKNFEFKHKPIFLIRHPIDTCLSQIKAFKGSDNNVVKYEIPQCINNERFIEYSNFLSKLESKLEVKVANWCINNCPTLDMLDTSMLCVVFYSDLLFNPEKELERILELTDLGKYKENLINVAFRKASDTDFKQSFKKSPQLQLDKNIDTLDLKTKDKIQSIFNFFNFKLYTAYSTKPNKQYLT